MHNNTQLEIKIDRHAYMKFHSVISRKEECFYDTLYESHHLNCSRNLKCWTISWNKCLITVIHIAIKLV